METPQKGKGKGGSIKTERNPFIREAPDEYTLPRLAEASLIPGAIDTLLGAGCALIVGGTRDGGAVCITILDGDRRHRTYCSSAAELNDAARAIIETFV